MVGPPLRLHWSAQVLEDAPPSADRLDQLVVGVVPHLLALFCSPHSDVKRRAVGVMNQLAAGAAGGLGPAMETYRLGLFRSVVQT